MVRELETALERGADAARAWLISERGRRYRAYGAGALVLAAPAILKHPIFRTPIGRIVQLAGGAALVKRVAELSQDWEPTTPRPEARSAVAARSPRPGS